MATGRPKKQINKKAFEELCKIQCTQAEICDVLDVSEKTLDNFCHETYNASFSKVFAQKRNGGRTSLRRSQWELAKTNATMSIWLGKQYLGQSDGNYDKGIEAALTKLDNIMDSVSKEADKIDSEAEPNENI